MEIQVYRLVAGSTWAPSSGQRRYNAVCVLLASLACGRVVCSDDRMARNFYLAIARKSSPSRPPGLDIALRHAARIRERDIEMVDMTCEQATEHLLKRWDRIPLNFTFTHAIASASSAGGEPSEDAERQKVQQKQRVELSYQLQLVEARKQVDAERELRCHAQVQVVQAALGKVFYVLGRTHVQEVCATLNQVHCQCRVVVHGMYLCATLDPSLHTSRTPTLDAVGAGRHAQAMTCVLWHASSPSPSLGCCYLISPSSVGTFT